jgi:GT2 family glycosyltransferase
MSAVPKVMVSIVNWNSTEAVNQCLAGIARLPVTKQPDVVVADNHSTNDRFQIKTDLKRSLRSLETITNSTNLGFAGGHNPNIRKAKAEDYDYIILLNPDTEIIDSDSFSQLIAAIEDNPRALAANPTILSSLDPDKIWYGGGKMSLKTGSATHLLIGESADKIPTAIQTVSLLTGGCLAINLKRAPLEVVLLPEVYFVYWEDNEWCARALKAGFDLLYVPQARLLHHVSSSLGISSPLYIYYVTRNHLLFIRRNVKLVYRPIAWLGVVVISAKYKFNILFRYKNRRLSAYKALWQGWLDGLAGKTGETRRQL